MNRFTQAMQKLSDAELVEAVTTHRADYQLEAIEAADAEISRRALTVEQRQAAEAEVVMKEEQRLEKADEPLSDGWKAFVMFAPGVLPLIFAAGIGAQGYQRKKKEIRRFTFYGVCGYAVFFAALWALGFVVDTLERR